MEQQYHYFTSSFLNWAVSNSLSDCLRKQKKADRNGPSFKADVCNVYRVPCAKSENYKIDFYAPQVEGTEWVGSFAHTIKGEKQIAEAQASELLRAERQEEKQEVGA